MLLRPAKHSDIDRLFDVHRAALKDYVELTWGWDEAWQIAHFHEHFDPSKRLVISCEDDDIGFLDLEVKQGMFDLQNIEIDPAYQGRGIGTRVIRLVLADAEARCLPVRPQVLKVNPRARRLYEQLGFIEVGQNDTHIQFEWTHC